MISLEKQEDDEEGEADSIIGKIIQGKFSKEEVGRIANSIGIYLSKTIKDSLKHSGEDRANQLLSYSYDTHYKNHNSIMKWFLEGIVGMRLITNKI